MKKKLEIEQILKFLDSDKSQFDRNYETLYALSFDKPKSNSLQELGVSIRCSSFESGMYVNEKNAKMLRKIRTRLRSFNWEIEEFLNEIE